MPALECQAGATLTHTALDDALTRLGLEACTETVRADTLDLLRLVVSLHGGKIARISLPFKRQSGGEVSYPQVINMWMNTPYRFPTDTESV